MLVTNAGDKICWRQIQNRGADIRKLSQKLSHQHPVTGVRSEIGRSLRKPLLLCFSIEPFFRFKIIMNIYQTYKKIEKNFFDRIFLTIFYDHVRVKSMFFVISRTFAVQIFFCKVFFLIF